uniref:Organic cation/carnitine transporter 7-like n=1 Tax=Tanacetum cinerariifolium TaxID=118510 RepID=A0A6L2MA74_TANCI|nr:organic cation/carnitine transporter 7-like [Tanacetum cinerariifolium]
MFVLPVISIKRGGGRGKMDLERLSYTVDEGISAIGMGRLQYMILAYAGVGALGKAMELMPMTYVGLEAQHDLELSNTEENIISFFTYIAMVVGTLTWGFVMDRWGTK